MAIPLYYIKPQLSLQEIIEKIEENPIEGWSFISKDISSIVYEKFNPYQDFIKQPYSMRVTKPIATTYYRPEEIETKNSLEHCIGEKVKIFVEKQEFMRREYFNLHALCNNCGNFVSYEAEYIIEINENLLTVLQKMLDVDNDNRADDVIRKQIYNRDFKIPKKFIESAKKRESIRFKGGYYNYN